MKTLEQKFLTKKAGDSGSDFLKSQNDSPDLFFREYRIEFDCSLMEAIINDKFLSGVDNEGGHSATSFSINYNKFLIKLDPKATCLYSPLGGLSLNGSRLAENLCAST